MITTEGATYLDDLLPSLYVGLIKGAAVASVNDTLSNHAWTEYDRYSFEETSIVLTEPLALGGFFLCTSEDNSGVLIAVKTLTVVRYAAPGEIIVQPFRSFQ